VSVDWYTRLEQGRASRSSAAVLDARASVDASLAAALAAIASDPAIILGPRFDVLATNALGEALFEGFATGPFGRNAAWFTLWDPRARALFPDHAKVARETVGIVRGGFAKHLGDARYFALVTELSQRSLLFVQHWPEQYVAERGTGRKRSRPPRARLPKLLAPVARTERRRGRKSP
jgi:hypothetical protein